MLPSFHFRRATADDAPRLREIVYTALQEHGLEPDPAGTDADLEAIDATYRRPGCRLDVLVDESTERVIGSVGLVSSGPAEVELRKMYLAAEYRRRGLGCALLAHALRMAREMGYRRVCLETASALGAAIRLYEKYGFERAGDAPHAPRCDVVMARDLE